VGEGGSRELDADDRAAAVELLHDADRLGCGAFDDPDVDVIGLFADYGSDDADDSTEIDVEAVDPGFAGHADDAEGLFAFGVDGKLDEAALADGGDHAEFERVCCGWGVEQKRADDAVGDVGWEIEMLGFDLFLAVFVDGLGSDLTVGFYEHVEGFGEVWTLLDVVIADEAEGVFLGEGGGFVVCGAVFEVEEKLGGDAGAVGGLDELSMADDDAAFGTDLEEAVHGALGLADGDGIGVERGGCESDGCGEQGELANHAISGRRSVALWGEMQTLVDVVVWGCLLELDDDFAQGAGLDEGVG